MPKPEAVLWYHIRNRQLKGYKFRRQFSVQNYIMDFYCPELRLAIEIDGDSHFVSADKIQYDKNRGKFIERKGIKIIRFTNVDVAQNIEGVLTLICTYLP